MPWGLVEGVPEAVWADSSNPNSAACVALVVLVAVRGGDCFAASSFTTTECLGRVTGLGLMRRGATTVIGVGMGGCKSSRGLVVLGY